MPYIIIDLERSRDNLGRAVLWKAGDAGYTDNPFFAGIYDDKEVQEKWEYYNDGFKTVAIPVNCLAAVGMAVTLNIGQAYALGGRKLPDKLIAY